MEKIRQCKDFVLKPHNNNKKRVIDLFGRCLLSFLYIKFCLHILVQIQFKLYDEINGAMPLKAFSSRK